LVIVVLGLVAVVGIGIAGLAIGVVLVMSDRRKRE
jgi:hypothetical protein